MKSVFMGDAALKAPDKGVTGEYVTLAGERYYKISHFDRMLPFFMSIVSDSDHWMFISSNGALTAGRKNPDSALFPYYTDDKIQDSSEITGSKTILFVNDRDKRYLWEPFSRYGEGVYAIERNCYKNVPGNKLIFEEINRDLEVTFQYAWQNSERFGFVKKSCVTNQGAGSRSIELLDGIQNILVYGINQRFQNEYSTLADAYKKCERVADTGLGIYSLSSIPVDKAEPSEALKATVVWSAGLTPQTILLSSRQLPAFRKGLPIESEADIRAARGAYLLHSNLALKPGGSRTWMIVADIEQDAAAVASLNSRLGSKTSSLVREVEADVARGTANLVKIVATADGLQKSAEPLTTSRHFSNVLFNIMRGGILNDGYQIGGTDFAAFVRKANRPLSEKHRDFLKGLPEKIAYHDLITRGAEQGDADLEKLCCEYLPLTFSRRHGDPSRPWNRFSIEVKDDQGAPLLNYQGNWRDIFQNWEALALSFPEYLDGMITKFVNASTADGYNPYRVTRDGFDWEVMDPDDAWSYIGYWGDHQIIYLLKLLELSEKYYPGRLQSFLTRDIFAYANVPYRIKGYSEMLDDPHNTVDFDLDLAQEIEKRVAETGTDGKFIRTRAGSMVHVNFTEKLLVPILAKLSNFIPEGGIWMNTQRPEWNDANNALVGNGVSMVTLYYLRRHLAFCRDLFAAVKAQALPVSEEVAVLFEAILTAFDDHRGLLKGAVSDTDRKTILDRLCRAGSDYRSKIYNQGFSERRQELTPQDLTRFCERALGYIDHAIRANRRPDHLYHAYNLMRLGDENSISIRHLYEMLEGQVAVLSSGYLSPKEALQVLQALRKSRLFREDQYSYVLYPNRQLPRFIDKNNIPEAAVKRSTLLKSLLERGDRHIVVQDADGGAHFSGGLRNARELAEALDQLPQEDLRPLVEKEREGLLQLFEDLFDHQSFTGRSGTFYKYEGLGSIYWHMVSKLLLTVQENYYHALATGAEEALLKALRDSYFDIKKGIGVTKSPALYGAFPTDPYSHTPEHTGVQQPGMTGQVKEDILSQYGELGVMVLQGKISFYKGLLRREAFLNGPESFEYYDVLGNPQTLSLEKGCLAFTLVQVPIIYHLSEIEKITVTRAAGLATIVSELTLDAGLSAAIFSRSGDIRQVDVFINL